jgi:hypothetical protein
LVPPLDDDRFGPASVRGIRTDGTVIGAGRFDVFGGRLDRTAPSPGFVGVRLTPTIS